MSDKTLQVANTIRAFDYGSDNRPQHLLNSMIEQNSITNGQLVDTEITINGTPVVLGGSITIHTGGTPVVPGNQSRLTIGATPSGVEFADSGTTNVVIDISITSGYTINSGTLSTEVRDQHNAIIGTSGATSFTVEVDRTLAGQLTVTSAAQVTRTSDGRSYHDSRSINVPVNYGWYYRRLSSAPTSVSQLTDQGVWPGDETFNAPSGTDTLYIAVPARSAGYALRDGDLRIFVPGDRTTPFDTHFELYSTDAAVAGTSYDLVEV